ncbi:MAG: hypothetical protein AB8G05_14670 [Oligoflexales bacterium]
MQKISKFNSKYFISLSLSISILTTKALADSSISDQLDSKLLEKERGSQALYTDKTTGKSKKSNNNNSTFSKKWRTRISGGLSPMNDLNQLDKEISKLNSNLKILTAKVKQKQQEIMHEMNINNLIVLEVTLAKSEIANIQHIEIKIDGTPIHSDNFSSLWIPKDSLQVYYGSLSPGNHRIDIVSRIVLLNPSDIPLNDSLYRMINQSFQVSIPVGSFKKKWVFTIYPPKNINEPVKAKMFEGNLNS